MSAVTVHKAYVDFEKEERWLNAMAAEGRALVGYRWCSYRFEPCAPGEWTYRIQFLEQDARTPKSREYVDFVTTTGVEAVASYGRWVYFRKRASEGPFELFSDLDSRIAHSRRLLAFYSVMTAALAAVMASPVARTVGTVETRVGEFWGLAIFIPYLALVAVFLTQALRWSRRVRELSVRRQVEE